MADSCNTQGGPITGYVLLESRVSSRNVLRLFEALGPIQNLKFSVFWRLCAGIIFDRIKIIQIMILLQQSPKQNEAWTQLAHALRHLWFQEMWCPHPVETVHRDRNSGLLI
ncbi:uncharacterized protein TNCV_1582491 [Trichonephila clavipes]|nr:uncharacterized protein TNCV_1582491 [Trichonephila clavipes]